MGAVKNTAKAKEGSTVAIFGLGGIGLAAIIGARMAKASRIIAIDTNPEKFDKAKELGATDVINPVQLVTGRVWRGSAFGGVKGKTQLPGIVKDYMDGEFALSDFITHTIPLEQINEAFDLMDEGKSIRTVIHYSEVAMKELSKNKLFGGWHKRFSYQSTSTGTEMPFAIYLPPQVEKEEKVPVLYFLSGLTCTDENFSTKAGAQQYAAKYGMALVVPDTSPRGKGVADDESYDL